MGEGGEAERVVRRDKIGTSQAVSTGRLMQAAAGGLDLSTGAFVNGLLESCDYS